MRSGILKALLPPVVTFILSMVIAESAVRVFGVSSWFLPPPSDVFKAVWTQRTTLALAALTTAEAAVFGFALSAILGVLVAVGLSASRLIERAFYPYTVFFQTVPIVAIAPLLVIWFGPGMRAVAVSAFIVAVFPVIANTLTGLRSTDPALRDLFRLYGAGAPATLLKLKFPSAIPNIVTGLRIASGLAVIGAIVGEFVAGFSEGNAGLGITVLSAYRQWRTDVLFAAVLIASLLGLLLFGLVHAIGHLLLRRWHASEQ